MIGNFVFECDFLKNDHYDGKIVGFENHSGRTYLGPGVKPLGKIIKGYGNNGEDGLKEPFTKMFTALIPTEVCFQKPGLGRPSYFCRLKTEIQGFVSLSGIDDEFENLSP